MEGSVHFSDLIQGGLKHKGGTGKKQMVKLLL